MMTILLWVCPLTYWWLQNTYFGWNARPQSEGEVIADGITILLIAVAAMGSRS